MKFAKFARRHRSAPDADAQLRAAVPQLRRLYPAASGDEIERLVFRSYRDLQAGWSDANHPALPEIAVRFASERLGALHRDPADTRQRILFLSTRNDGMSQIAAGFVNHVAADRYVALSAALTPADKVLRSVRDVMSEASIPLHGCYPKPLTDEVAAASDVIVTMICEYPLTATEGQRMLSWDFEDPAGLNTPQVRLLRDRVSARVREFLAEG